MDIEHPGEGLMNIDEELVDFVAQGLKIFGPTTRVRIEAAGQIGKLTFPSDPSWRAPAKRFQDTRNLARSNNRGSGNGKGKRQS